MYSSHKPKTTYKVLIACTPNDTVSFVSELFDGLINDKEIVMQSKFLDLLAPGNLVLTNRGCGIKDLSVNERASLNISAFLKGRDHLTAREELEIKNIAN